MRRNNEPKYTTEQEVRDICTDYVVGVYDGYERLEKRLLVLEDVLKGMQLPEHLTIGGMTYKRQPPEVK
jgi:hypothetical protein